MATILQIQPVLPVQDIPRALVFYGQLGFATVFIDNEAAPRYAGIQRDGQELHLQWHATADFQDRGEPPAIRFKTADVDALYASLRSGEAIPAGKSVHDTAWGTREFEFYDPDGNALFFYQDIH